MLMSTYLYIILQAYISDKTEPKQRAKHST